ncbi:MAG: M23 family metallopeptidase [Bdellovibrionales bacterium]|nr:M23 family metallopeptidase [Bdellovibrionales bacterium]
MTACSGLRSTQGVYKSSSGYSGMGEFSGPGSLSQPEYEGPMPAPEDDGDPRNYVTPKGLPAPSGPFTLTPPVQRMRITQRFANPKNPRHQGIDIGGRIGTPIYAAHEGVIVYAGTGFKGYGRLIIIEFDKTWASLYAHMSVLRMKTGDTVRPGQEIGLMGKSGRVTGVHLHFELLKNKQPVDPLEYFSTSVAL